MNALTEAIKKQYQRQQKLIAEQDEAINALNTLQGKINPHIGMYLVDAIRKYFKSDFDRIDIAIQALEGVRDATD